MTQIRNVIMPYDILNAFARIRHIRIPILHSNRLTRCRILTSIVPRPPRKPLRDRRQTATVPQPTRVIDGGVREAVEFENRQGRARGGAVAVVCVGVESTGDRSEGGEGGAMGRGAGEGVGEAAAVGHAVGVDARRVDAVGG